MIYIIGAGVAGLITSLFLLEKGNDVTIIEKEDRIKSSVCGEGCDLASLHLLPFNSSPYFEREIKGIRFIFGGKYFYARTKGVVLNRQKWLQGMAKEVMERGGKIHFSVKARKIDSSYIHADGEKFRYDICIGADGPLSVARKYVGRDCRVCVGVQYEMELKGSDFLDFYISRKYSRHYAWIFPKKNTINVGLIGNFSQLDKFVRDVKLNGRIISKGAGIIPYDGTGKIVRERVALIGDAACMANPFSLGGISPSIYAAKILANNVNNLEKYEKEVNEHAIMSRILMKGRRAIDSIEDEEIENILKRINGKEIREIKYGDMRNLIMHPLSLIKFYRIGRALIHSLKWGW